MNRKYLTYTLIALSLMFINQTFAQDSNSVNITPKLAINAYLEAYYGYDFSSPESNRRPGVLYNYTDHDKLNINAGIIGLAYRRTHFR